jgi:Fe-Mn family superoxide dismutase
MSEKDRSLSRRGFLQSAGAIAAGALTLTATARGLNVLNEMQADSRARQNGTATNKEDVKPMAFEILPLPYAYEALEPTIDAATMHLHHDKHHQTYADNFNAAVAKAPALAGKSAEEILAHLDAVPEEVRGAIRNHGGGYANHNLFWTIMGPNAGGAPGGALAAAIEKSFGSFEAFQEKFNDAGAKQFGSGWVWLAVGKDGLHLLSTANQDTPLSQGLTPILLNDVWEHAYYLKYQNRRAEYLKTWWKVVNWTAVEKLYAAAAK